LLVGALRRLRRAQPRIGLVVMGGGDSQPSARALLEREGLKDAVLLLGDVRHELCLAVMARADLFVRATLADGDALSVREALALGVPVVASDAARRPPGTALFRSGSEDDLVAQIEVALSRQRPSVAESRPSAGCIERLLEIYGQVAGAMGDRVCAESAGS